MHQQLKYIVCHNAASATATGTAIDITEAEDQAYDLVAFQISGTYVATVTFQGTVDGTNWVSIPCVNSATGVVATTATANGVYRAFVAGYTQVRANMVWSSGTSITVVGQAVQASANSLYGAVTAITASTTTIGATLDAGPAWTTAFGVTSARYTSADRSGSAASVTDAPTSGQKLVITDLIVAVDTAMRVDFKEETSGTVLYSLYMAANGTAQITPRGKLKLATVDKKLQVQTSVAGNISVTAFYYSEA